MSETTLENAKCVKCDVPVRENTQFCYNCGSPVAGDVEDSAINAEGHAALDELADKLKGESSADDKMAKAAAERKKARVGQRRSKEYVWQPKDDISSSFVLLVAVIVSILAGVIVFATLYWR